MAFKAEIDDTRASLSYKFKKVLTGRRATVLTTDPFVTTDPDLLPLDEVIARSDLLILCTPHACLQGCRLQGQAGGRRLGPSCKARTSSDESDAPPRLDIVIPVYNEGANILRDAAGDSARSVKTPSRVLICYDREDDDTLPAIDEQSRRR